MSTAYGKVKMRDGRELVVEAFGATSTIKLQTADLSLDIAINDPKEVDKLIAALEMAKDHIWLDN